MKKKLLAMLLAVCTLTANAQEKTADSTSRPTKWYDNLKFSGYGMLQYQFEDREGATTTTSICASHV